MKKFLNIISFFLIFFALCCCGGYKTAFINDLSRNPQHTVDSILSVYGIVLSEDDASYLSWPSAAYYTSDSTMAIDYISTVTEEDTIYIISVTVFRDAANDSTLSAEVNARKEIR